MKTTLEKCTHCYVGRKTCGCVMAVVVDEPDRPKDTARSVAEFIKDGLSISRMLIEDFRNDKSITFMCTHSEAAK